MYMNTVSMAQEFYELKDSSNGSGSTAFVQALYYLGISSPRIKVGVSYEVIMEWSLPSMTLAYSFK